MALEDVDIDLLEPPSDVVCEGLKKLWAERTVKEEKAKKEEGGGDDSDNDFDWWLVGVALYCIWVALVNTWFNFI